MDRLAHLAFDDLHDQLDRTEGNVPTQRVLAAIGRKQGATLAELAERHNVTEKTIRNWLHRFADRPLDKAPYDDNRSGRPPKLSADERTAFFVDLLHSPEDFGFDRAVWEPELVHHHLLQAYGVNYSLRHVYRLLEEVGVAYRTT